MLKICNISKKYYFKNQIIKALDNINLTIYKNEIVSIVGGSGSGKTTLGKILLGILEPTEGKVYQEGLDVTNLIRPKNTQMIFQDPYSSLNPRMTVEEILQEPAKIHKLNYRIEDLLSIVHLPKSAKYKYPHEFSGGQRQRIAIARALSLNPKILICDEAVSSLDSITSMQIIELFKSIYKELDLTLLFITHNLMLAKELTNRTIVMKNGKVIEDQNTQKLFIRPEHPYTQLLLTSANELRL